MDHRPPPERPPIRVFVLRIAVFLTLSVAGMVGSAVAYAVVVTNPAPHVAVLDRLAIPPSWTLVDTTVVENPLLGSRVERYYFVDADPEQLVEPARQMLIAAGFALQTHDYPSDWCTDTWAFNPSPAASAACPARTGDPCWVNGRGGPTTCGVGVTEGRDRIAIDFFDRGEGITYFVGTENHNVRAPGLVTVRVTDEY